MGLNSIREVLRLKLGRHWLSSGKSSGLLQLVLYARPRFPNQPHFALYLVTDPTGPTAAAVKHDAADSLRILPDGTPDESWRYQSKIVPSIQQDGLVVVRATVGTYRNSAAIVARIEELLVQVPCYQKDDPDQAKAQAMDCVDWVQRALEALQTDQHRSVDFGNIPRWEQLKSRVLEYEESKRLAGRWRSNWKEAVEQSGLAGIPTLDLRSGLPGQELVC